MVYTDLCTPWKCFQYSENKFPYSAIIFRSFFSGATYRRNRFKKKKKKKKKSAAAYRHKR